MVLDQKYRSLLEIMNQDSSFKDSLASSFQIPITEIDYFIWTKQQSIDSSNLIFIEKIIDKHGYPGKSMVGDSSCEVSWYVIQHSFRIENYFPAIKEAGKKKEVPLVLVAMMEDRLLMQQGKCQKYGTQGQCISMTDSQINCFIWPIKNPRRVNKLRKNVGFKTTVEENAARLNIKYEVVSLSEIKNIKANSD